MIDMIRLLTYGPSSPIWVLPVSQRKPAAPPLELVYRQSVATIKELVRNGHGQAALVSVGETCGLP